jgi:hypothetical protein
MVCPLCRREARSNNFRILPIRVRTEFSYLRGFRLWRRSRRIVLTFWSVSRQAKNERTMAGHTGKTTTHGRNMAGARGLWRATGMKEGDFGKPIVAVVNSFTQFVPGHVHLKDLGQLVAREIEAAGGVAKEFNTIAIDDGIAMGHDGMLYSLPSRE